MMRGIGAAVFLFLLAGQGMAAPPPTRIMSLKICTDELLMDLVPPSRIASLTFLSQEKAALKNRIIEKAMARRREPEAPNWPPTVIKAAGHH